METPVENTPRKVFIRQLPVELITENPAENVKSAMKSREVDI